MLEKVNTEKRMEIIEAALQLFSERGFEKATVDEIANKANVGKGTIYLYFKNKEQIFMAVIEEGLSKMITHLSQIFSHGSFMTQLREMITYHFKFVEENKDFYKIFLKERLNFCFYDNPSKTKIVELHHQLYRLLEEFFHNGIKEGYLRLGNPNYYSLSLSGMISHFIVHWLTTGETESITSMTDTILEIFLTGAQKTK